MTPASEVYEAIAEQRALAIVRLESAADGVVACRVLAGAGMRAVEISLAQPDAAAAIAEAVSRWSPLVKLFPAGRFGPGYVKDLRAPLPDVTLLATGGVDLENARAFLDAGAAAVAVGSALVNASSLAAPDDLAANARRLLQLVAPATPTTRRQ